MTAATRRKAARLGTRTSEMLVAAPQVVAHRLTRMALAGPRPGQRDRAEFHRMGAEKVAAFAESWQAMTWQMWRSQQQLAASLWRSWWSPLIPGAQRSASPAQAAFAWQAAMLDILGQGIRPVHRRATANVRRLQRTKRR